ncbi:hypothetical protein ACH41H_42270 [Streptomyces sp. NPDC020800]|uniref:hypothetical protein n=1 Tax=Streptomyces sp. NPDC020800 TaxID=3365092 RepID=UPI0037B8DF6A
MKAKAPRGQHDEADVHGLPRKKTTAKKTATKAAAGRTTAAKKPAAKRTTVRKPRHSA